MMQAKQCSSRDGYLGIGSTLVIAEVDFEHPIVELLDDSSRLTPNQDAIAVDQKDDGVWEPPHQGAADTRSAAHCWDRGHEVCNQGRRREPRTSARLREAPPDRRDGGGALGSLFQFGQQLISHDGPRFTDALAAPHAVRPPIDLGHPLVAADVVRQPFDALEQLRGNTNPLRFG